MGILLRNYIILTLFEAWQLNTCKYLALILNSKYANRSFGGGETVLIHNKFRYLK